MMNTYEEVIAGRILDVLRTEKYCTVPAKEFLQLWFNHTNRLREIDLAKRFIKFKKDNNLDYVIIMSLNGGSYEAVRFWKVNRRHPALTEELNEQDRDDRIKTQDGECDTECSTDVREGDGSNSSGHNGNLRTSDASAGDIPNNSD